MKEKSFSLIFQIIDKVTCLLEMKAGGGIYV
jgi:hypothetical protein